MAEAVSDPHHGDDHRDVEMNAKSAGDDEGIEANDMDGDGNDDVNEENTSDMNSKIRDANDDDRGAAEGRSSLLISSSSSSLVPFSMDHSFLYQNPRTGEISKTKLTTRQLCRILCPPSTTTFSTPTPSASSLSSLLNASTNVLPLEMDGSVAFNASWKPAGTLPVLRQTVASWFYQDHATGAVQGPISCRDLAQKLQLTNSSNSNDASQHAPSSVLTVQTAVYGSDPTGTAEKDEGWQPIAQRKELQVALQAFEQDEKEELQQQQQQERDEATQQETQSSSATTTTTSRKNINHNKASNAAAVQQELEAFLSLTAERMQKHGDDGEEEEEEAYQSDGGTHYTKDPTTGAWQRQSSNQQAGDLNTQTTKTTASAKNSNGSNGEPKNDNPNKKKRKRSQFAARNARNWIYVTGLPSDATEEEVARVFSKAGIIDLDPRTQQPKIKLYRLAPQQQAQQTTDSGGGETTTSTTTAPCKGDASICFARPESVDLAITLLDEAPFRYESHPQDDKEGGPVVMSVQRAKFEAKQQTDDHDNENVGNQDKGQPPNKKSKSKSRFSEKQRQVARMAALQALDWDDGEINGRLTGGRKGLRIIVLKHVFDPRAVDERERAAANNSSKSESHTAASAGGDEVWIRLQEALRIECEKHGHVEKITVFSKHPEGVVVVKFTTPGAASDAVRAWQGRPWYQEGSGREWFGPGQDSPHVVQAIYWDGATDYSAQSLASGAPPEAEEEKRIEEFGDWLDSIEELPEELKLQHD